MVEARRQTEVVEFDQQISGPFDQKIAGIGEEKLQVLKREAKVTPQAEPQSAFRLDLQLREPCRVRLAVVLKLRIRLRCGNDMSDAVGVRHPAHSLRHAPC